MVGSFLDYPRIHCPRASDRFDHRLPTERMVFMVRYCDSWQSFHPLCHSILCSFWRRFIYMPPIAILQEGQRLPLPKVSYKSSPANQQRSPTPKIGLGDSPEPIRCWTSPGCAACGAAMPYALSIQDSGSTLCVRMSACVGFQGAVRCPCGESQGDSPHSAACDRGVWLRNDAMSAGFCEMRC